MHTTTIGVKTHRLVHPAVVNGRLLLVLFGDAVGVSGTIFRSEVSTANLLLVDSCLV